MSYGISFEAYLNRVTKDAIPHELEDSRQMLDFNKNRLLCLTSNCSQLLKSDYDGEPMDRYEYVAQAVPEIVEEIATLGFRIGMLEQAMMADKIEEC